MFSSFEYGKMILKIPAPLHCNFKKIIVGNKYSVIFRLNPTLAVTAALCSKRLGFCSRDNLRPFLGHVDT